MDLKEIFLQISIKILYNIPIREASLCRKDGVQAKGLKITLTFNLS